MYVVNVFCTFFKIKNLILIEMIYEFRLLVNFVNGSFF